MLKLKLSYLKPSTLVKKLKYNFTSKNGSKRFLGIILILLKISTIFKIKREGYQLFFFPTSLSLTLFQNSDAWMEEEELMKDYLKEDDIVIDIGANIGSVGLKAASLCPNGKVYMIEAHPETYMYMKKNVGLNNFNNVLSFNVALGKEKAEIRFSNITQDDMNGVAVNDDDDSIIVPLEKLDDILEGKIQKIDFLKIDVEGFEMDVFKGADKTLKITQCILYESWDEHFSKYGTSSKEVRILLESYGFTIFKMKEKILSKLPNDYASNGCDNLLAINDISEFKNRTGYSFS